MGVEDLIEKAASALVPPLDEGSKRLKYDATISVFIIILCAALTLHMAIACNYFDFMGISGFAQKADVTAQGKQLKDIRINQLDRDVRDAKVQVCQAVQTKNQAALSSWATILHRATVVYSNEAGKEPEVQSCEELLVGPPVQ